MVEFYFFVYLIGVGSLLLYRVNFKAFYYIYLPSLLFFMIIVRSNGFDTDIQNYINAKDTFKYDVFTLNNYREFIFWGSFQYLFDYLNNPQLVFFVYDFLWIFILYLSARNMPNRPFYALMVILATSFPLFLGYENIYRQLFGVLLVLYSLTLANNNKYSAVALFIVSIFFHNATLIFVPIIVLYVTNLDTKQKIKLFILMSLAIIGLIAVAFIFELKSVVQTGISANTSFLYIALFLSILFLLHRFYRLSLQEIFITFPTLIYGVILTLALIPFSEILRERIGMMLVVIIIYELVRFSASLQPKKRKISYLLLQIVFTAPIFLFASTMSFFKGF